MARQPMTRRSCGLLPSPRKVEPGQRGGRAKVTRRGQLTRLSSDGATLARAVAGSLGIAPLDLPWAEGPRLWRNQDIAAHVLCLRTMRVPRMRSRKRETGTNPSIRACQRAHPTVKAGDLTMARAGLSPRDGPSRQIAAATANTRPRFLRRGRRHIARNNALQKVQE
jgi:hypothetical protein